MPAYYNPAATGLTDFLHITAGSRLQWVGMPNAPTSFIATADMPVKVLGKRVGVGVGYAKNRTHGYRNSKNEMRTHSYLVWTERGRRFIHELIKN